LSSSVSWYLFQSFIWVPDTPITLLEVVQFLPPHIPLYHTHPLLELHLPPHIHPNIYTPEWTQRNCHSKIKDERSEKIAEIIDYISFIFAHSCSGVANQILNDNLQLLKWSRELVSFVPTINYFIHEKITLPLYKWTLDPYLHLIKLKPRKWIRPNLTRFPKNQKVVSSYKRFYLVKIYQIRFDLYFKGFANIH